MKLKTMAGAVLMLSLVCVGCGEKKSDKSTREAVSEKSALTALDVISALDGTTNLPQLTVSPRLQRQVTAILARHADTNHTGQGWAVVMSVKDGGVLAMADCGSCDASLRPLAVKKTFEPGHTASPIAVAIAFNDRLVSPNTMISTKDQSDKYVRLPSDVGTSGPSAMMSVKEALPRSSNVILGKIGQDLGDRIFSGFAEWGMDRKGIVDFGLFKVRPSGFDLKKMSGAKALCSRVAIGQGYEVNALQLARAYAILANKGYCVEPCIERRAIRNHKTGTTARRIVLSDAVASVCDILKINNKGTGRKAAVPSLDVSGKTGTSHSVDDKTGEYSTNHFTASFAGFFPSDNPSHVVVVGYETAKFGRNIDYTGGERPALAFAEIAKVIMELKNQN